MEEEFEDKDFHYEPLDKPIPGMSLTVEPGSRPWEQPPSYTDTDDFLDVMFQKFTEEENAHRIFALMEAGLPIETLVRTTMLGAFTEGKITPDVALLAAGPMAGFLKVMADDAGIKAQLREDPPKSTELADLMEAVKKKAPELNEPIDTLVVEEEGVPPAGGLMGPLE